MPEVKTERGGETSDQWEEWTKAEGPELNANGDYEVIYWEDGGKRRGAWVPRETPRKKWLAPPDLNCNQFDRDGQWIKTDASRAPVLELQDKCQGGLGECANCDTVLNVGESWGECAWCKHRYHADCIMLFAKSHGLLGVWKEPRCPKCQQAMVKTAEGKPIRVPVCSRVTLDGTKKGAMNSILNPDVLKLAIEDTGMKSKPQETQYNRGVGFGLPGVEDYMAAQGG